MQPYNN